MTFATRNKLKPENFTSHHDVQECISELKKKFGNKYERLVVSDTLGATPDENGVTIQYVDLVQKGGGVLGIALVGYTYILEEAGIRFMSLAGTSAGAINTAMIGVIGKDKSEKKSLKIIEYLSQLNFFDMVDGHPVARTLIRRFIKNKDFTRQVKTWITGLLFTVIGLLLLDILFLGLTHVSVTWSAFARTSFVLTGMVLLVIICIVGYANYLLSRLKSAGYGINPGTFLLGWIKEKMQENDVHSIKDLEDKVAAQPLLRKRHEQMEDLATLKGSITFITAELVTQNKVEFPKMWDLFHEKNNGTSNIHPAFFVRASMSIPIFFEACIITNIDVEHDGLQQRWKEVFGLKKEKIPHTAKFVDGGMLSNFPLNIFYNPKITTPRMPSFGIDLDDSLPHDGNGINSHKWTLGAFAGKMLNTMRGYYDKDFVLKNKVYERGVGSVSLNEFNWLNFFLTDQDKIAMFVKGAQAAKLFLETFDWAEYKKERAKV